MLRVSRFVTCAPRCILANMKPSLAVLPGCWACVADSRQFSSSAQRDVESKPPFVFTPANFIDPKLPAGLTIVDVPIVTATDESLEGFGRLIHSADELTVEKGNFEIKQWPQPGWRPLDPGTGDEAGTTEGYFDVHWVGDFFYGKNLAVSTLNNTYLDGLAAPPEMATHEEPGVGDGSTVLLWMSDYHPDGGQLFWPLDPKPFVVCLGPSSKGDDIKPSDMRAFYVPAGQGVYFNPGTWHNGVQIAREHAPQRFLTRQGRVHARVSVSWAAEFGQLLRMPLCQPE
eukprot:TRINITY_DN75958_c0_g1_i1.p1 TRINITY_DN75958_c0_g1~~TRINITY_DN75958_c0_g1_i1.p1  ORF type:complete len:285 (-),score=35.33 TRINITY_DN75958_c0_g1_i1:44-898(-)